MTSHFFQATWLHTSIYSHKRSSGRNGWAPALVRCCWLLLRLLTKWCHPVISWSINHSKYRYIYHKPYLLDLQTNLPKYGAPPCKDCFLIPKKKKWWTWWDWHHWCWQRMDPMSLFYITMWNFRDVSRGAELGRWPHTSTGSKSTWFI